MALTCPAVMLLLCVSATVVADLDLDYGGVPVQINRLLGEPSVTSLQERVDAAWFRANNPQACPQQCDCPIQWPAALYCDHRGLADVPDSLPNTTQYLFLQLEQTPTRARRVCCVSPYGMLSSNRKKRGNFQICLFLQGQQHLVLVLLSSEQVHRSALAHPGPQRAAGPGRAAEPDADVLPFRQPQPPAIGAERSARRTEGAATGPQPNQQRQSRILPEPAELDTVAAAGKQTANRRGGRPQRSFQSEPAGPGHLPSSVQQLCMSNNTLLGLDEGSFVGVLNLKYLRLSRCGLQSSNVHQQAFNFTSLVELDLSYSKLKTIPTVATTLQYLYLEANEIQDFNVNSFCRHRGPLSYSRMKILRLEGNKISYQHLPSNWVFCLRVLESIYI